MPELYTGGGENVNRPGFPTNWYEGGRCLPRKGRNALRPAHGNQS